MRSVSYLSAKARTRVGILYFVALLSTALALGPALAHAFELPNKIGLTRDDYFTVQQIYRGWNRLAIVILVQLASMIALAIALRGTGAPFWWTVAAIACLVGAQLLFWLLTQPTNAVTDNWRRIPENWATLRARWEYSHLGGAGFQLLALSALILGLMRTRLG
jgi:hypothetical protein